MKSHVLVAVLAMCLTPTAVASGYWTAPPAAGGSGSARAASVNQGVTPSATATNQVVTVSWTASTLSNGQGVTGYLVARIDSATLTAQTVLPGCAGTITATSCTETGVPEGSWRYTVTPVIGANWRGAESALGAPVVIDFPPANNLSVSATTGAASLVGTTVYYRGTAAGGLTITNTVTDVYAGPASSTTSSLSGTTTGWTHSGSTVSTPTGGPFVSNPFSWTAGTTSSPQVTLTGRDVAGYTAQTTLAFANDSTGPTGGSVDASGLGGTGSRYAISTTLNLILAKGTDPSGVATSGAQLRQATATLSNGACGTYGSYSLVTGGTDPASPKTVTVGGQACYRYEYVVSDTLGNSSTYTSPDIKVDTTASTTPTLAYSALTNTYASGGQVFYRSLAASGSFTVTATASDSASGIASYSLPSLGTGWTSTAGALGVKTYSWSGAPGVAGTHNVTASNNAGLVSPNAVLTLTADDAAPTAGTVTYANSASTATSVAVSFTTGTDAGSGIASRLLQRASASLTNSDCGTYGAFVTLTGGTNPASPFTDSVTRGNCYQYRYVVTDNLGNQHIATSTSVAKVWATYVNSVNATAGLLNYFRLGEAITSHDSFTNGALGDLVQNRIGETGATWTKHALASSDANITTGDRIRKTASSSASSLYYTSGVPASADYTVEANVYVASNLTSDIAGVVGRLDPANANGTFYVARYEQDNTMWNLHKYVNGVRTLLGQSTTQALASGASHQLALDMRGSTIRVFVDGVQRISVTDTAISAAGRGGFAMGFHATATTTVTSTAGLHLDSFRMYPPVADSAGTNDIGRYLSGVVLGLAGAITGDSNTAADFDGINDFASVTRTISDDFSIEFWFKSTQGIGTGTTWQSGAGLIDANVSGAFNDFGVSLRSDGKVIAGVGGATDVSLVSTSGGYNDDAWHHVVFTRTRASGALALYVDGVAAGTATGSTVALTTSANITFGRIQSAEDRYYDGSLDEVALYNTVLPAATVTAHHGAAQ